MSPELTNAMLFSSSLILVGIGVGFLLLKLQGKEEVRIPEGESTEEARNF